MNEIKNMTIRDHLGGRAMPTPLPSAAIPCAVSDTHDLQGEQISQRPRPGHAGGSRPSGHGAADALSGGKQLPPEAYVFNRTETGRTIGLGSLIFRACAGRGLLKYSGNERFPTCRSQGLSMSVLGNRHGREHTKDL